MSPFDLRGPEFLVFYVVFCTVLMTLAWFVLRSSETGPTSTGALQRLKRGLYEAWRGRGAATTRLDFSDPYLVACLRGGPNEALRLAVVSLVDRELLTEGGMLLEARAGAADALELPIERAVAMHFARGASASGIFDAPAPLAAAARYQARLVELGLAPDGAVQLRRLAVFACVLALALGVAATKIAVALSRGRQNVLFLVLLAVAATWVGWAVTNPRLTARGQQLLADLRQLFAALRSRTSILRPGEATGDVALAAAVFGLEILPDAGFARVKQLFAKASSSWSSDTASCGSSWSSCGGGGSGCGGGGGGGCGGCGS